MGLPISAFGGAVLLCQAALAICLLRLTLEAAAGAGPVLSHQPGHVHYLRPSQAHRQRKAAQRAAAAGHEMLGPLVDTCGPDCWFDYPQGTHLQCADAVLDSADVAPTAVHAAGLADADAAVLAVVLAPVDAAVMPRAGACLSKAVDGMKCCRGLCHQLDC